MKPVQKFAITRVATGYGHRQIHDRGVKKYRNAIAAEKLPGNVHGGSLVAIEKNVPGNNMIRNRRGLSDL